MVARALKIHAFIVPSSSPQNALNLHKSLPNTKDPWHTLSSPPQSCLLSHQPSVIEVIWLYLSTYMCIYIYVYVHTHIHIQKYLGFCVYCLCIPTCTQLYSHFLVLAFHLFIWLICFLFGLHSSKSKLAGLRIQRFRSAGWRFRGLAVRSLRVLLNVGPPRKQCTTC